MVRIAVLVVMIVSLFGCKRAFAQTSTMVQDGDDALSIGDFIRAAELYQQACKRAAELFQQACDGGEMRGCYNLGISYANGTGVPIDLARAAELYQQACDGGYMESCNDLGVMYEEGRGVPQDERRAGALYQQGCNGGYMESCNDLAASFQLESEISPELRAEFLQQDCDGEEMEGCNDSCLEAERLETEGFGDYHDEDGLLPDQDVDSTPMQLNTSHPWAVVAGSFRDQNDSNELVRELRERGFTQTQSYNTNNFAGFTPNYYIAVPGAFSTGSECQRMESAIDSTGTVDAYCKNAFTGDRP